MIVPTIPPRLLFGAVAALALIGAGWQVNRWRTEAGRVGELEQQVRQAEQERDDAKQGKIRNVVRQYRLDIGRGADLGPAPVVRLCGPPPVYPADAAGGADGAAPGTSPVRDLPAGDPGPVDVGSELVALMRVARDVAARLKAVQALEPVPADVF